MATDRGRGALGIAAIGVGAVVVPGLLATVLPGTAGQTAALALAILILLGSHWFRPLPTIAAFALLMLFVDTAEIYVGPWVRQVDELTIGGFVAIALIRRRREIVARFSLPREAAVVALVALALVSSLANDVPIRLWAPGMVLLVKGIAFFYVALLERVDEVGLRPVAVGVLAVGVVVLAGGVVQLVAPDLLTAIGLKPPWIPRGQLPSITSVFYHPVLFAWFTSFIAIYLFLGYTQTRRGWMLILGALMATGTVLAARRRAMLALGAAVVTGLGHQGLRGPGQWATAVRRWSMPIASLMLIAVFFQSTLTAIYRETIESYTGGTPTPGPTQSLAPGQTPTPTQPPGETEDASTPARLALYRGAVRIATDHFPLGAGLGRYGSWMSRVEYSPLYVEYGLSTIHGLRPKNPRFATDTFWPQIAGEIGWLGVAAYVGFLATIGIGLWRASRRPWPSPFMGIIVTGAGLVLVQSLVESLASAMFHSPARVYLALGAMAIALAAVRSEDERATTPVTDPAPGSPASGDPIAGDA